MLKTIRAHGMLGPGDLLVVGVSGGLDSACLLGILRALEPELPHRRIVAHVNHGLRAGDSDEDERFVERLARGGGDELRVLRMASSDWPPGESRQAAARDARYAFFRDLAKESGASRIAVAHHADDLVETVLMRLIVGCSPGGAVGIRPNEGDVARPLIETSRAELVDLAAAEGIEHREDSSNRDSKYLRNRVRWELLPVLEALNPEVRGALGRFALAARRDDAVLRCAARDLRRRALRCAPGGGWALALDDLAGAEEAVVARVLFRALTEAGGEGMRPTGAVVESLLKLVRSPREGTRLNLARGLSAEVKGRSIEIRESRPVGGTAFSYVLPVPGDLMVPEIGLEVRATIGEAPATAGNVASLATAAIGSGLVVRSFRPGDRFRPEGMGGHSQKLGDYFTDKKIPRPARMRIPLIISREGTVLWVVGHRLAEGVRAPAGSGPAVILRVQPPDRNS